MNILQTMQDFNKLYYELSQFTWDNTSWMGRKIWKNPCDMWILQEILFETKPDLLIETGTYKAGSALFYAHMFDIIGSGVVLTIDINLVQDYPQHPRLNYLHGSSVDISTIGLVENLIKEHEYKNIMIILDSDHSEEHVFKELQAYSKIVGIDKYLIVEDTNVGGPMNAVNKFLAENDNFRIDRTREKFMLTFQPFGYLKRIK